MRTSIVIPCYNEAERLPLDAFRAFAGEAAPGCSLLFVDDGSSDRTRDVLRRLCEAAPDRYDLLCLDANQGKGEAVRQGVLKALSEPCDAVGYWDADLSASLRAIPLFVEALDDRAEAELILGSRAKMLGRHVTRSGVRHLFGRAFASAASLITGLPVYDSQCGAKLFRVTPSTRVVFERPFVSRWFFDVEILIRLTRLCCRGDALSIHRVFYELPLPAWHSVRDSKIRPLDVLNTPLMLVRIWLAYSRGKYATEWRGTPGRGMP